MADPASRFQITTARESPSCQAPNDASGTESITTGPTALLHASRVFRSAAPVGAIHVSALWISGEPLRQIRSGAVAIVYGMVHPATATAAVAAQAAANLDGVWLMVRNAPRGERSRAAPACRSSAG